MRLVGDKTAYEARPNTPVRFSGSESIVGHCNRGPVENFNLIFDPVLVDADVKIVLGSELAHLAGKPGEITALHVLNRQIVCDDAITLPAQDTCVCSDFLPILKAGDEVLCAVVSLTYRHISNGFDQR